MQNKETIVVFVFLIVSTGSVFSNNDYCIKINEYEEWLLSATHSTEYKILLRRDILKKSANRYPDNALLRVRAYKLDCDRLKSKLIFIKYYSDINENDPIEEQIYDDMWDYIPPREKFHQRLISTGICLD